VVVVILLVATTTCVAGVPIVDMAPNCTGIIPSAPTAACVDNFVSAFNDVDAGGQILVRPGQGAYDGCLTLPANKANITVRYDHSLLINFINKLF
jgi:hypothetical protein